MDTSRFRTTKTTCQCSRSKSAYGLRCESS